MVVQHFAIPTRDGRTQLTGRIDFPTSVGITRHPIVMIVPGGWFMDRDGYMGGSGTDRDLIYRDLANDILAAGIAAIRYDNRGVRCNEMTMPPCRDGDSQLNLTRHYLDACVDADVRQTISVQTQMDDVDDVWAFVGNHPRIDATRSVIWAHSEGCLNTARLVSAGRLCPKGLIFVGAATESPVAIVRWQVVDRYAARVMTWDSDSDGRVTTADVERQFPTDALFTAVSMSRDVLMPPTEGWTWECISAQFTREYEAMKAAALAKPDDAPYPDQTPDFRMVAASNNWWKQWFLDTRPVIDHIAGYTGSTTFHIGGIDSQNPGERELSFAESRIKAGMFARAPRLVFHENRGHSLRTGEPAAGPMDEEAKAELLKEITALCVE